MPVKQVSVELGWGPAKVSGIWEPESAERDAAWELYVELVTRIAVVPLGPGEGILRETFTSLYGLFGSTREILRKYGPAVARPAGSGRLRFGYLAVWVLNAALRPVLARWHPELQRWEAERPADRSIAEHEAAWPRAEEVRAELERLRTLLVDYARALAAVCEGTGPHRGDRRRAGPVAARPGDGAWRTARAVTLRSSSAAMHQRTRVRSRPSPSACGSTASTPGSTPGRWGPAATSWPTSTTASGGVPPG